MNLILLLLIPNLLFAFQQTDKSVDEILGYIQSSFSEIKDYTVQIHAEIEMEDIDIPPMEVTVYFKQPDRIHLESEGFAMLPREGMFLNPGRFNHQNFYITLLGKDSMMYKLELVPRKDDIMVRKLVLWIDPTRWIVMKVQTTSWQGQTTQINFEYSKIQDKYWLPIKTFIELNLAGFKGLAESMSMAGQDQKKADDAEVKKGKITVEFFNYQINRGLSDSIFEVK